MRVVSVIRGLMEALDTGGGHITACMALIGIGIHLGCSENELGKEVVVFALGALARGMTSNTGGTKNEPNA